MTSMQEEGLRLIREAEGIFRRDTRGALNEKDFNMVVRRAQEVVELTLKGALKILGVDYPKVHDVAPLFSEKIRQKRGIDDPNVSQRIEEISLWLAQSRTPSFYFDRGCGVEDAEQALKDMGIVFAEITRQQMCGEKGGIVDGNYVFRRKGHRPTGRRDHKIFDRQRCHLFLATSNRLECDRLKAKKEIYIYPR